MHLWDFFSAQNIFKKYADQLAARKAYIEERCKDARDALGESKLNGSIADMEQFDVDPLLFDSQIGGPSLYTTLPGAQAMMTCHKSMPLRGGVTAIPAMGTGMGITPVDEDFFFSLTRISGIVQLGVSPLGPRTRNSWKGSSQKALDQQSDESARQSWWVLVRPFRILRASPLVGSTS